MTRRTLVRSRCRSRSRSPESMLESTLPLATTVNQSLDTLVSK